MEKRHLRNLLLRGALAAGLGVAAERGCDKDTERDTPPPKPKAEQIHKPEQNTDASTRPGLLIRDTREKIGTAATSPTMEDAGGFGGDDAEADRTIDAKKLESEIEKAIPGIDISSRKEFNKRMRVGDYNFSYPDEKGNYTLRQLTEVKEFSDGTEFQAREIASIEPQPDGTILIAPDEKTQPDISCDLASLPDALREYMDFRRLKLGDIDDFDRMIFADNMEYNKNTSVDDLLRAQRFYQSKIRDKQDLLTREWRFVRFDKKQQAHAERMVKEYEEKIVALQQRIVELTR